MRQSSTVACVDVRFAAAGIWSGSKTPAEFPASLATDRKRWGAVPPRNALGKQEHRPPWPSIASARVSSCRFPAHPPRLSKRPGSCRASRWSAPTTTASSPRCWCRSASASSAVPRCSRTSGLRVVRHVAPAAGTVAAIHRGEMRAFQSIVIDVNNDDGPPRQVGFASYTGRPVSELDADAVRALLLESGAWTALRARPFSKVPSPASAPHAIFVTAIDTHPHAPAVDVVLAQPRSGFPRRSPGDRQALRRHDVRLQGRRVGGQRPRRGRTFASRSSRARTRPARWASTSTCSPRSISTRPCGTSVIRMSPRSAISSRPAGSTSNG